MSGAGLPEGVSAAMFLRDGWPDAIVCKVLMKTGCIGIGIWRRRTTQHIDPALADQAAMVDALQNLSAEPPDYSEIHEHVARQRTEAEARHASPATAYQEEPDVDLQAQLGQKAHE